MGADLRSAPGTSRPDAADDQLACPICGSRNSVRLFRARDPHYGNAGEWWQRECLHCRGFFVDPMPRQAELASFYPEDEYYAYRPARTVGRLARAIRAALGYSPGTREPAFGAPGRVLDFGCGAGDFLVERRARGWQCHGVELSERAIAAARARGLDVRRALGGDDGFPDADFDYVRANHALEHVLDPAAVLREMHRVLRPGGTLFIGVPTRDGLPARLFREHWWYLGAPVHPVTFSTRGLTHLLERTGFRLVRVSTNSDYGSVVGSLQIALNRHNGRRSSDGALFRLKPLMLAGHWAARALDLAGQGDKLEVIAVKPPA